ncbi:MAG: CmpA/NrtA family ABC transporter substrate-binding protein, partial [Magnetospiraceae bacterium]
MSAPTVNCGFLPLVDAAPLIIAQEFGFADEEGFTLALHRQPSWSAARDRLALGQLDAAHMLSPVPVAMSMGLWGMPAQLDALLVLSVNGNTVGVPLAVAERMRENGFVMDFTDARGIGARLIEVCEKPLRAAVPFPFSMHLELIHYWLEALGLNGPDDLVIRTVPPPLMTEAVASGDVDLFCVGEPWGSMAVEKSVAELILPGRAIWQGAPEKVLCVRHEWTEQNQDLTASLIRAVWRAGRWLSNPSNRLTASEILSQKRHLDVSPEIIDRTLTGHLTAAPNGLQHKVPQFLEFFANAATFPWRSQAVWMAHRLAIRWGADSEKAIEAGRTCYRSDLYREALATLGQAMPITSEKVEGTLVTPTHVASASGELELGPDRFFDGRVFDPY